MTLLFRTGTTRWNRATHSRLAPRCRATGKWTSPSWGPASAGLWTSYYLLKANPSLRIVVIDAQTAGFGASGRNGGWCVPEAGSPLDVLDKEGGPGTGAAMLRAMHRAVDEVGDVARREQIDCGFAKGGALWLASDAAQLHRLRSRFELFARHGLDDAYQLLDPIKTIARVNATGMHGSIYTPHAAAVHPARLARGLARAVERLGATVHEMTPALRIDGRRVVTPHGTIVADVVVRATEAYTASIEGLERMIVPLGNYVIATDPIPDNVWAEIGLTNRELFEDTPVMLAYGQRTADGRIVWGGMGAPYWFGSKAPPSPMQAPKVAQKLKARLIERFPMLRGHRGHAPLGRRDGDDARHALDGRLRQDDRRSVGRWFRRRRRCAVERGRPDAGRIDHRRRLRAHAFPMGQPSLSAVGTRAASVARRQRDADAAPCLRKDQTADRVNP